MSIIGPSVIGVALQPIKLPANVKVTRSISIWPR